MLSYVGQPPRKPQDLPLAKLVQECITTLKDLFYPAISLTFIQPDQPLDCSLDQLQIKEVIENILTNAVESLENNPGTIEITFGTDYFITTSFPVAFQNETLKDGMYSFCQIKDSGHGINPDNLSRIFEPFYTTRFVGRGLGLALAVGIMQSHHGAVTVESALNKGTTVRVLLPSIPSTQQMALYSDDVQNESVQLSGNILLADDEDMVLEVGRRMLGLLGFTVHTATNGQEAVDLVRSQSSNFCTVVLDISMPEMDGVEAMQAIRKINSTIPIVLSSGYSEDEFSFKKEPGGKPDGFLKKPFQLSDIRSCLKKLLF